MIDLKGAHVAIVTPFRNGQVDYDGLKKLIEFQIDNGTHGIVACGTTGESPTLSHAEHKQVIQFTVKTVNGRVPVMAGTGSNSTAEASELTQFALDAGANASLNVCPYYNKPTERGVIAHFRHIADNCELPIILYNIPGRTGINMSVETILTLAKHKNIVGIKEASGSVDQASQILERCPKDFAVLSGDDALTLPIMALGGTGVVSTTSNVAPRLMATLCNEALEGNFKRARDIHTQLVPLMQAMFCESNPVPAKSALAMMGLIENDVRLPLVPLTPQHVEQVRQAIKALNII